MGMLLLAGDVAEAHPLREWMVSRPKTTLYMSSVGLAWILSDIEAIGDIGRRGALKNEFEQKLEFRFQERKIPLDDSALRRWTTIRHTAIGNDALSTEEAMDIAIALTHNLSYVARHTPIRAKTGVLIEDPFADSPAP